MKNVPTIGLLPFYLELYDRAMGEYRPKVESFAETIAVELSRIGIHVERAPVCRVKDEFDQAVRAFELAGVDCIVTLHLAYSPSEESVDALAGTKLPVIVLDTTPDFRFDPTTNPDAIMLNHGIHGVQDMCNLLMRRGKAFRIEAGHWRASDVLYRVAADCRAALAASRIKSARIGLIGSPFKGMGDFAVPFGDLKDSIGIETVQSDPAALKAAVAELRSVEVDAEMQQNRQNLDAFGVSEEAHRRSVVTGLAVRRWIEQEKLSGFTMNFLDIDSACGLPTVPFLEASKAMSRGLGYAGEGDVLTAALVGALASVYEEVSFTEMFCPDWRDGSVFLSHMGEINPAVCADMPVLIEPPFPYTDAAGPVSAVGRFKTGEAVLVDVAPMADGKYGLIVAPGEILDGDDSEAVRKTVRGWFKPEMPLEEFLSGYSNAGGTHHLALVYGNKARELAVFGTMMGWNVTVLGG